MEIKTKIESLLFICAKPISVEQLADILVVSCNEVVIACDELAQEYKENKRGIQIIKNGLKYQMLSSPANAELLQVFVKDETKGDLSKSSLETLTIIAYRGPITKIDLEKIRGVNCSLIVKNLLIRGLIEEVFLNNLQEDPLFKVTFEFIKYLGINDIKELPDYEKLNNLKINE